MTFIEAIIGTNAAISNELIIPDIKIKKKSYKIYSDVIEKKTYNL